VTTELGQTVVDSRAPMVLATAAGSFALFAALVSTPGISQLLGCTPVGPIGWAQGVGTAAAATVAVAVASRFSGVAEDGPVKDPANVPLEVPPVVALVKAAPAKQIAAVKKAPVAKKAPVKKAPVAKKTPAKQIAAVKKAPVAKKTPVKKAPVAKKAPAKKTPVKKAPTAKTSAKQTPVTKAAAKKTSRKLELVR
jgi:hypothetical protein